MNRQEDRAAVDEACVEGPTGIPLMANEVAVVTVVEAALMAAGRPLTLEQLADVFDEDRRPDKAALRAALSELEAQCVGRGFEVREVASGWRLQVRQELAPWVGRLWEEKPQRYTRALLETLGLIAYRQPVTRGEIEEIRGVSVSTTIIRTLQEREWVRVVGHRDIPGRPAMYATTRQFLDYFNLSSLEALPPLAELRDLDAIAREMEGGEGSAPVPEGTEAAQADEASQATGTDASQPQGSAEALVDVDASQEFQEQGEERMEKLFSELDAMEADLTMDYTDVPGQDLAATDAADSADATDATDIAASPLPDVSAPALAQELEPTEEIQEEDLAGSAAVDTPLAPEDSADSETGQEGLASLVAQNGQNGEDSTDSEEGQDTDALTDIMDDITGHWDVDDDRGAEDPLAGL